MSNLRDKYTEEEWDALELKHSKNEHNLDEAVMINDNLKEIARKTPNDKQLEEVPRKRITKADWDKMSDSLIGEKKVFERGITTDKQQESQQESQLESDPIVDKVLLKFATRSKLGITKYGTTLQDNNASLFEWLNHLQEELMDATLYIEKLKQLNK